MDKEGKYLSLTFLGNQAKKSESHYYDYGSCSQSIQLENRLDIPEQNSLTIHMLLGSSLDRWWTNSPMNCTIWKKENPTSLLISTHFQL